MAPCRNYARPRSLRSHVRAQIQIKRACDVLALLHIHSTCEVVALYQVFYVCYSNDQYRTLSDMPDRFSHLVFPSQPRQTLLYSCFNLHERCLPQLRNCAATTPLYFTRLCNRFTRRPGAAMVQPTLPLPSARLPALQTPHGTATS